MFRWLVLLVPLAACHTPQPPSPPRPPPRPRVDTSFLEQYAATYRFRLGQPTSIAVTPDGEAVLFLRSGPRSFVHDLYLFDTHSRRERRLLGARELLQGATEQLSAEERARRERQRLMTRGITGFRLSEDGRRLLVALSGRLFVGDWRANDHRELPLPEGSGAPLDPRLSPDGKQVAYVRDGDLHVLDVVSGQDRCLTHGPEGMQNGLAEFVAQEEMGRQRGFWWSPDSSRLVYQSNDTSGVDRLYVFDPSRPEQQAHGTPYPRAGRANARVRLGVISSRGGETRWLAWDRQRYPYLVAVKWPKGAPLTLVVQNRRQTELAILVADTPYGQTRELLREEDAAWVNIDQQMPRWLPEGRGFLWTTERQGAWQLELHGPDGGRLRSLSRPDLGYRSLLDVDVEHGELVVRASPKTPREVHIVRLPLDGSGKPTPLSRRPGWHDAVFAREHAVYVHSVDPLQGEPRFTVRRRGGERIGELRSVVEKPGIPLRLELLEVGERRLQAAVVRPRDFDRRRRYPVVLYAYAGPGYQVVSARGHRYLLEQWIADHGFVVLSLDGRGTPGRDRAWERAIKGNLIRVPLDDQIAGLRALARRFPELDLDRVGVFGWSFGGYFATMAVLERPDLFRCAVAGAPVTDWLQYDTHYTERYLGLPDENRAGYRASSALEAAPGLRRPLLVVHGTTDDNVYFNHSIRLADRLFRAGRTFDFLPLSSLTHLVPDPLVTRRLYQRIVGFFVQHLHPERP